MGFAEAFYDKHSEEIRQYESANKYIKEVLSGRTAIPLKQWKAEQAKLNLNSAKIITGSKMKRAAWNFCGAENLMRGDVERERPQRSHEMER